MSIQSSNFGTTLYVQRDWYRLNVSADKEQQLRLRVPTQWGQAVDHYIKFDDHRPIEALIKKYYDERSRHKTRIHY